MTDKKYPQSKLPIRQTSDLLPSIFRTPANNKFMQAVVDPLVQPGVLEKVVGYSGRRYGKTYKGKDIYIDTDDTLRSRYQLEPGIVGKQDEQINFFYDYLDFKNQLKFFGNQNEIDTLASDQVHYSWNPPIDWDKFINYTEYYWQPLGPPPIEVQGNRPAVVSSYQVILGTTPSFIFRPDGLTNNPTIRLYRGQTYKFRVNVPGQGFSIRSSYDSASLTWNPNRSYFFGELAIYDDKLWASLGNLEPGVTPGEGSQFWKFVELSTSQSALDYNNGVTNNGIENGVVTFTVPFDAPDVLYYQSKVDANRFGQFLISNIYENTTIDIEKEILGKTQYRSSNGVEFSNGLIVEFTGRVAPKKYSTDVWLVEGVGTGIRLINFSDLDVPVLSEDYPEVLFDNSGFDSQPFDDARSFPGKKDYITINRSSVDLNPWSRYNRWFHKSVLEYAYKIRGTDFPAEETARAKRPIIEFLPDLKLFNHGATAKRSVDFVENFNTDVFSIIEGSTGYYVDGEQLFDGARILVTADEDNLANNRIYKIQFITHNNRRQIALREESDSEPVLGDSVLVKRGKNNAGLMYHFTTVDNENRWVKSQEKLKVNQPPLFDAFDDNGVSFSDIITYPINNFQGTKIVGYRAGNGKKDIELGFSLSYQNIDNVGDIEFDWNWGVDQFVFTATEQIQKLQKISNGFYLFNNDRQYENGWIKTDNRYIQPIIDSTTIIDETNEVKLTTINWEQDTSAIINFYLNGIKINDSYSLQDNIFTFERSFKEGDVVSVKVITIVEPNTGYYEIPVGIEKNPLNEEVKIFTLGQAGDHVFSAVEFNEEFVGIIPGNSNLRDISGYEKYAKRFMKHESLAPLSLFLLCDKNINVIKSLQFAKKSYINFKSNFLNKALELEFNDNIADFIDEILTDLSKVKNQDSVFFDSDVIGSGAYTSIDYIVEDEGIKTFALSSKFNLKEKSRRAVYVYLNGQQLLHGKDYSFNDLFGFITIEKTIDIDDRLQIREYVTTSSSFIPPTPTCLGLYKKYQPQKFIDDTYRDPREVIQGHDGSLSFAFGDFRDDLLLELEYRIYNNIKTEYDESVVDIDLLLGGYYGNAKFTKSQLDAVIIPEFLKYIQNTDVNYTLNEYFKETETFTYTYSNMSDPSQTQTLPGWWRGVYKWFYDTDRPHRCPWEMLGFSEQPSWWEDEYGSAPYTRNNLILWEDLSQGIVRRGPKEGFHPRYSRPTLLDHIPVDGDGELLSPLDSGLAQNFVLINNKGNFKFGDISPVEHSWRTSSDYPFSVIIGLCLLSPFDFISRNFDRTKLTTNKIQQVINPNTKVFITLHDFNVSSIDTTQTSGLIDYIKNYVKSRRLQIEDLENIIQSIDVALSTRLSGFVDKSQHRYLLDSKNPRSTSGSVYVPVENYDIIFNVSSPIQSIAYSGVILEKTEGGWLVSGYDGLTPYFNYYQPLSSQQDPFISVGGVSETFSKWETGTRFSNGQIVLYRNDYYRAVSTHESSDSFDPALWRKLPNLPVVGAVTAFNRRNFNRLKSRQLDYGTKLNNIQGVVDFLLGYEEFLKSQGFIFDNYDPLNRVSQNWLTSCKEFMFWTKQNWEIGSLITLSPASTFLKLQIPIGVVDNILDGFYDYQVYRSDGNILDFRLLNINRSFQTTTFETTDDTDGIYYIRINFVLKEHVTVFNDRTIFNDVIYDKTTGYRQDRIKTQGFRTVDWDGDYTSPGFLFDNVNIEPWQPFVDYKLGDIVEYQSRYWTSQQNQLATEVFDDSKWQILDLIPEKQLIPNFDYKINQFEDYYEASSEGIGQSQRQLARHSIGYQERSYLKELSEDPVTQFQIYQGFIREKGTTNSISKVFDKLGKSGSGGISIFEEWAFRIGSFGGSDQTKEFEFSIRKDKFVIDPQPIIISNNFIEFPDDQYYRVVKDDFSQYPEDFSIEINPMGFDIVPFKTAGYVRPDQVEFTVATRDDILDLDIADFQENNHIWITFDGPSWNVLKYNVVSSLSVFSAVKDNDVVTVEFNEPHGFEVGEIVGLTNIKNLTGFYKILSVTTTEIELQVESSDQDPELDLSSIPGAYKFTAARFISYDVVDQSAVALMPNGSRLWIDQKNNIDPYTGRSIKTWEVIEKTRQYFSKNITSYGGIENLGTPDKAGSFVLYDKTYRQAIMSVPGSGYVLCYQDSGNNLNLQNIIEPPTFLRDKLNQSYGARMAISPDSRWLVISAFLASNISSYFRGLYDPDSEIYNLDDIVLYAGRYYKKVLETDDSTLSIDLTIGAWEPIEIIAGVSDEAGSNPGYIDQGVIFIYEKFSGSWTLRNTIISPNPSESERFGESISISKDGDIYYMAVSAPGSSFNRGRVYLYQYDLSWRHYQDRNYRGIYNTSTEIFYPEGSIVWYEGKFWKSTQDLYGNDEIPNEDSSVWNIVDDVITQNSLPQFLSTSEDGTPVGVTDDENNDVELVNIGDRFGFSVSMNETGSRLIVGAPYSDTQYFEGYRGIWQTDSKYIINEVVQIDEEFYKLIIEEDIGTTPLSNPDVWQFIENLQTEPTGKVFVYERDLTGVYELIQTINLTTLEDIDQTGVESFIENGDLFGYSVDIDQAGETFIISAPLSDIVGDLDRGAVYIFKFNDDSSLYPYRLSQKIVSFESYNDEYFGYSLSIADNGEKIVIGARNAPYPDKGFAGAVYVFDQKDELYFLTEKLETDFSPNESFGQSVDVFNSTIVVGSPNYIKPEVNPINGNITYDGPEIGIMRVFKKDLNSSSWQTIAEQSASVNINKVKQIALFDLDKNQKIADIDFVDPAKLKILNLAEQEITFKTPFDPAIYSIGVNDETQTIDPSKAWTTQNVGKLWWNLSTAKWIEYEQGDISFRAGSWGQLVEGSTIDIYEWIETRLRPSEWSALADTNEGLALGVSGQPLYPDDDVLSIKDLYNEYNGEPTETLYYYWVRSTVVLPANTVGRRISAADVASLIRDPKGSGESFIALIDKDKFLSYNFAPVVTKTGTFLNIEYYKTTNKINPVHYEYQLLTEGISDSLPTTSLENKWIDSLVGYDSVGNAVPDVSLPIKQRYGLSYRPRQSMFIDRIAALKLVVTKINDILKKDSFGDFITKKNLESFDNIPIPKLNLYDLEVDNDIDLINVNTARIRQAVIFANIINGEIDSVDIINPGFGYRVPPFIFVDGDGKNAKLAVELDVKGRIINVRILNRGKRYNVATVEIRPFSVLVKNDSNINGFWSIYAWDDSRKIFYRSRSQSFDTRRYWNLINWWKPDYGLGSRIIKEILSVNQEPTISVNPGDLIRIKEYGSGGWAVFERNNVTSDFFLEKYVLVGRENGTIELSSSLYDLDSVGIGFDNNRSFDIGEYDIENYKELRNIIKAVKEDIFIGDYAVEWNQLFFSSIRYVFAEQSYVDWAFKTSFIGAIHDVGLLEKKLNYKNDNLSSYQDYINEVKPYRTTVREYVSKYNRIENSNTEFIDFDLPSIYSEQEGKFVPVNLNNFNINKYPWKYWLDNQGFSVIDILITDGGSGYTQTPTVIITGNGSGASAKAFISGGSVKAITVINFGQGYTQPPNISFVGGNNGNLNVAKAVAVLGDSKIRNIRISSKFDRVSKTGIYENYTQEETFIASGFESAFALVYPCTRDKSKIQITIDNKLVLNDEYKITFFTIKNDSYVYQKGRVIFDSVPRARSIVKIIYEKSDEIFDSVNRIEKFYSPTTGMKGKDLYQLMTGMDFGGVKVQGSSFGITAGWDASPWYSDSWDSLEPLSDFYYVFSAPMYDRTKLYRPGSTIEFGGLVYKLNGTTSLVNRSPDQESSRWDQFELENVKLPYVPIDGQEINIYRRLTYTNINYSDERSYFKNDVVKFQGFYYRLAFDGVLQEQNPNDALDKWIKISETYRVDDPAYGAIDSSELTNPNVLMPTFFGDGSTDTIDISNYFTVLPNEILIFRPAESDGSFYTENSDVLDTNLTGGSLSEMSGAYITATGITAEEIAVDGGIFISADAVPAPEENVPGQVLDSVTIRIFQKRLDNENNIDENADISAFEIHKDMLNIYYFKRYSIGQYRLANNLNYYDLEISLNTGTGLVLPKLNFNSPGTIEIGGERIEFLSRNNNKLSRLRRGSQGTSIGIFYEAGNIVANISYDQTLPYRETQSKLDVYYNTLSLEFDGSTNSYVVDDPIFIGGVSIEIVDDQEVLIGNKNNIVVKLNDVELDRSLYDVSVEFDEIYIFSVDESVSRTSEDRLVIYPLLIALDYVPTVDNRTIDIDNEWHRDTIPFNINSTYSRYGQCNEIEVFVGGRRKRKSPISVYDETLGISSPSSDRIIEADFSVNGLTSYLRLTNIIENAGTRITIIRKSGRLWYERSLETASKGIDLLQNNTPVARFIEQKSTDLPE